MPSGTYNLYDTIALWQQVGIYDLVLPFLLVFTLVFAVLQKIQLFGKEAKKMNVIIALVLALLFLQNPYLLFLTQRLLPNISFFLIIFLMFLLLIGIFLGGSYSGLSGSATALAFIVSIIAVITALSTDFLDGYGILDWWYTFDPGFRSLLWFGLIVIIIIVFITRDDKKPGVWDGIQHMAEGFFGGKKN